VFRLATCTDRGIITVAMAFLGRRMCRRHYTDWNVGSAVVALLGQGISFAFHHQVYHDMALLQSLHSSSTHHSIHHDLATCNLPVSPKRSASIRPLAFRSRINNNNNLHVHPHLSKESRIPHDDAPSLLSVLPLSLLWISNTQLDDQLAHSSPVAIRRWCSNEADATLALHSQPSLPYDQGAEGVAGSVQHSTTITGSFKPLPVVASSGAVLFVCVITEVSLVCLPLQHRISLVRRIRQLPC